MSSSGATKSKPKKTSNLRILWIPGRKKHNRKGSYSTTKNGLPQTYGMQPRKNESWTLGGAMNHSKIINANFFFRDLHENNLDVASIVTTAATGSAMAAMVKANEPPTVEGQQQLDQQLSNEPCPSTSTGKGGQQQAGTPQIVVGTIELNNLNGDVANHKEKEIGTSNQFETLTLIDEDDEEEKDRNCSNAHSSSSLLSSNNDNRSAEENNLHNASTLAIGEQHRRRSRRRSSQKDRRSAEDIDSIDQADSAVDVRHDEEEPNVFDDEVQEEDQKQHQQQKAGSNPNPSAAAVRRRKNQRQRSRQRRSPALAHRDQVDGGDGEEQKEPYEKAVTCLYWSLACWDCNIS
ncbi:heat shock protein DDB_G0288861 isoform X2 [Anopheles gambiae]|uniref:heat shock protein DDB_G0288861 isoform X2 n=1 Tax=Anopheles gambiae TaxID=7165 RepID=UPI002AC93BC8|nr:heat shock protein DDB_G0288861 isoform X2 [Anopheles gambiae]